MRDIHFPGRSPVYSQLGMVSTSHPLATKAAADILTIGGNAMDAAITAASVLAVVEPHSTGIGGDLFCLYYPKNASKVLALNASGKAPKAASLGALTDLGLRDSIPFQSPHSVSIPTGVAGWLKLIEDHGSLSMKEVLKSSINYARNGYVVADVIADVWRRETEKLSKDTDCKNLFLNKNNFYKAGEIHYQPELADTLESIAENGRKEKYEGIIAQNMVQKLNSIGGIHTLDDFAASK